MTTIKLNDGRVGRFITTENDYYKFFLCDTYNEAVSLIKTLTDRGDSCFIGENSRGWYVGVKKNV